VSSEISSFEIISCNEPANLRDKRWPGYALLVYGSLCRLIGCIEDILALRVCDVNPAHFRALYNQWRSQDSKSGWAVRIFSPHTKDEVLINNTSSKAL
jgi:hypothetical protein